uniref:Elapor1-like galactose binding domain-containing protein n=1 Tax=Felis catus TaxID=9685 RepID=A0ABI7ZK88_FELCA
MKDQSCKPCAEGRYSLGTGIRFDEWDELPHGFASLSTNMEIEDTTTESTENCTASKWVPLGDYISSNTDECTATLMYAVNLKQSGSVNFEYYYPDSSIIFEFFVQNDQCQPNVDDSRWMKTTEKGWEFHSVELNRGNNVLYWRTTAFSVWSKVSKPVLVRNIAITGTKGELGPASAADFLTLGGGGVLVRAGVQASVSRLNHCFSMLFILPRGGLHFRMLPLQTWHICRQAGLLFLRTLPSQLLLK